jgi:hypothetical protein
MDLQRETFEMGTNQKDNTPHRCKETITLLKNRKTPTAIPELLQRQARVHMARPLLLVGFDAADVVGLGLVELFHELVELGAKLEPQRKLAAFVLVHGREHVARVLFRAGRHDVVQVGKQQIFVLHQKVGGVVHDVARVVANRKLGLAFFRQRATRAYTSVLKLCRVLKYGFIS